MTVGNRRDAMRTALLAALATPLITRVANGQTLPGHPINPPSQAMLFRRSLERDMIDGAVFHVTRGFTVEFRRQGDGYMLHGNQSEVAVEAPARLAQFAEIERSRDESRLFPIALDAFGQILSHATARSSDEEITRAVEAARDVMSRNAIGADARAQVEQFIAEIQGAGRRITAHMPVDLFAPTGGPHRVERRIALPGGGEGRVATVFNGELDATTGLMRSALREIVTEIGDSRRTTRERWSLGLA